MLSSARSVEIFQPRTRSLSGMARTAASTAGTTPELLDKTITNLKIENENLKQQLKEFTKGGIQFDEKKVGEITLLSKTTAGLDKKQITDLAKSVLKDKTIACFLNAVDERVKVLLYSHSDHDAAKIIAALMEKLNGKCGGKKEFAMGSIPKEKEDLVIQELEKILVEK